MPEQEVRSPVCRLGSKVGSGQPLSPGARSNPARRGDSVPKQPTHDNDDARRASKKPAPASTRVFGPEE